MKFAQLIARQRGGRIALEEGYRSFVRNMSALPNIEGVDVTKILPLIKGMDFFVRAEDGEAMRRIAASFAKDIVNDAAKSSLGGENILSTLYATPEHPSSYHLMHFNGVQDKHFHAGPRLLNIFATNPWLLYVGGINLDTLQTDKIPLAQIAFPGNSLTQLCLQKNLIHGFEGKDLAAISIHYTDIEEVKEKSLPAEAVRSKEVMELLTTVVPQERLEVVTPAPISYRLVQQLLLHSNNKGAPSR